jgi:hypothetical protein
MTTRSWIRKLFARPVTHAIRKRPHRARPAVQALEDRTVPSTFTVTNLLDDGSAGSLRWAVDQANATGGDQTIDFDATVFATPQTITLSGTQLELTDTTGTETIVGPAVGVTVNGNNASRVFQIDRMVTASIAGLTITGGHMGDTGNIDGGGGLANYGGTLTLTDCTVSGNSAKNGGGLANDSGTDTLTNCTVSGNSAGNLGGGIFNDSGMLLTDCTISGNSGYVGGGLSSYYAETTLTNCTVSGNSATYGGGIHTRASSPTLSNTIVAANTSGGNPSDILGAVDANSSYNLIGTGGSEGLMDGVNHNQVGVANPGLGTLGDHGGPTQTIDLLGGSPALNAGDPAQLGLPDQRGVVRTGGVNIGAYQASVSAFVLTAPDTVTAGMPFAVTVTAVDIFAQVAVGYTSTVTFSTTDPAPNVVPPPDYAFTLADGGMHTFMAGFTLQTPGLWTLTATDTVSGIAGSVTITVGPAP